MKRLLVVCAASLLPCFLVSAQEADNAGRSVGLSVIPRLDLNPILSTEKGGSGEFTLGNTSLYSLFEGDLTENLSFSVCNHWAGFDSVHDPFATTKDLYQGTLHSDNTNWLDWAYLTYTMGSFAVTLGKDMVTTGGLEFDDYDFEVHPAFVSGLWNNFSCYQWGGKLTYTTPSEEDAISLQVTTSPFGERPFASKLFNYSAEWRGTHGLLETIWSATAVETEPGEFQPIFALGQRISAGDWTFGLDAFSVIGDEEQVLRKGFTLLPSVQYSLGDRFEILAKAGYENAPGDEDWFEKSVSSVLPGEPYEIPVKHWWGGLACHWYPIQDSRDLRVHAVAGYDHTFATVSLAVGLLYNLHIF